MKSDKHEDRCSNNELDNPPIADKVGDETQKSGATSENQLKHETAYDSVLFTDCFNTFKKCCDKIQYGQ